MKFDTGVFLAVLAAAVAFYFIEKVALRKASEMMNLED